MLKNIEIVQLSLAGEPAASLVAPWATPTAGRSWRAILSEHNESLRYLDTICLRFPLHLAEPGYIPGLLMNVQQKRRGFKYYYFTGMVKATKGAAVFIKYIPRAFDRQSYLYLVFSLPKVVIGTNGRMIPSNIDIIQVLRRRLLPVFAFLHIPPLEILQAVIRRLDISYNFYVGSYKQDYLDYLRFRHYPRRSRSAYSNYSYVGAKNDGSDNGVVFAGKFMRTSIYDKGKESRRVPKKGLIRLEASCLFRRVEKLFDKKNPTLADLSLKLVREVLQKELAILGLDRPIRTNDDVVAGLKGSIGATRASNLLYFMECERQHPGLTAHEMAGISGYTPQTVNKKRKLIRDLGICVHLPESITLPALSLDDMSSAPEKIGAERHSDTCVDENLQATSEITQSNEAKRYPFVATRMLLSQALLNQEDSL